MVGLPGRGGLPNHRALPKSWDGRHRATAEEFFSAKVTIRRHSSSGTFNATTGKTTYPDPTTVWTGWARIQRMTQNEITRSIGDRQVIIRGATVSIPVDADEVKIADEVKVVSYRDSDSGDPHLVGQSLWVHDILPGSLQWQRNLTVLTAPPTNR